MKSVFSVSSVQTYLKCPRKYYYKYVVGLSEDPTEPLHTGSVVHKEIEFINSGNDARIDLELVYGDEYPLADWNRCRFFVKNYQDMMDRSITDLQMRGVSDDKIADMITPKHNEFRLDDTDFVGFIDAVLVDRFSKQVTLVDYKTSRKDSSIVPEDYVFQLMMYAYHYEKKTGVLPDWVCIVYLGSGERYYFKVDRSTMMEYVEKFQKTVEEIVYLQSEGIEAYPCSRHPFCRYGSFKDLCGEF